MTVINVLEAVVTDLRWILKTERVTSNLSLPIETAELTLQSERFGAVPPAATAMSIRDLRAQLVDCAGREDDAGNYFCAERIRGNVRAVLGL